MLCPFSLLGGTGAWLRPFTACLPHLPSSPPPLSISSALEGRKLCAQACCGVAKPSSLCPDLLLFYPMTSDLPIPLQTLPVVSLLTHPVEERRTWEGEEGPSECLCNANPTLAPTPLFPTYPYGGGGEEEGGAVWLAAFPIPCPLVLRTGHWRIPLGLPLPALPLPVGAPPCHHFSPCPIITWWLDMEEEEGPALLLPHPICDRHSSPPAG